MAGEIHQGLSEPEQPEILFCETPSKLADNPFPVKFIVIQNKSAVSKHWISVANAEC